MIDVQHVGKLYGSFEAVRDVSFQVRESEIVGLLGPNGAGKTTIMKILTCYHFPSTGTVTLNGHDIYDDPLGVKRSVGYLPENAPVYSDLTVLEYLNFIAQARYPKRSPGGDGGSVSSLRGERIDWAVDECGLGSVANRPISQLSKGFRQRTGLAQAILHDPAILILDEPTSGLDPNQILEIRRLIRSLGKQKTVILSTHILQEVEAMCDRVMILNQGGIVAEGTTEEIGRGLKGEDVMIVKLRVSNAPVTAQSVGMIPGVSRVMSVDPPSGGREVTVRLSMHPSEDNGEAIFDWAVAQGHKIVAMTPQRVSLEDIFTRLTGGISKGGETGGE
ncbi:MAG TPA: ATP-binding cassette domain-containing protein [Spirochaetia bacterium]|nr:ATP-binding cassette domain-containing protein [Spirochaetia bacterium]